MQSLTSDELMCRPASVSTSGATPMVNDYSRSNLSSSESFLESPLGTPLSTRGSTPLPSSFARDAMEAEFSDESDDELQDWSMLNSFSKKGMKDMEPLLTDADIHQLSAYDQNKLNKARNMRFNALAVKRGAIVNLENLKASTIYINKDDHNDLFMLQPKGKFLETMGFIDNQNVCHFGFEEVLYLVERGSCMLKFWDPNNGENNKIYDKMPPLSLQVAYSILVKSEEQLTQYLVYSILKRDGYIITRHEEFGGLISGKKSEILKPADELFKNVRMSFWTRLLVSVSDFFGIRFPFKLAFSYFNIFTFLHSKIWKQSMSISDLPRIQADISEPSKVHKISFNVWKPSPNFKKKNPPLPDYQISIFKAAEKIPKYSEIRSLLERARSNPDTYKPKPKTRAKNKQRDEDKKEMGKTRTKSLDSSWDYSKGIDMAALKSDPNRITLAIVDNTTVNFITLSHVSFVAQGPVWRDHWVTWRPPARKNNKRNTKKRLDKNPKQLSINTEESNLLSRGSESQKLQMDANFDEVPATAPF